MTEENTEAQEKKVTCPELHEELEVEWLLDCEAVQAQVQRWPLGRWAGFLASAYPEFGVPKREARCFHRSNPAVNLPVCYLGIGRKLLV